MRRLCLTMAISACNLLPATKMNSELPHPVYGECSAPVIYEPLYVPPPTNIEGRDVPFPPGHVDALKAFAEAVARFNEHAYLEAARGFLAAAQLFELDGPYAPMFRGKRVTAYENAAIAYEEADALDEARQEFRQRAHRDLSCAVDLERIIQHMRTSGCGTVR